MGKTRKFRIGITGIANSGKTVFLTSLIDHLNNPDREKLCLDNGKKCTISGFNEREVNDQFNYTGYRESLAYNGQWPEKTIDAAYYSCSFTKTDEWVSFKMQRKKNRKVELDFFDFPGERFADVAMVKARKFSQWSEYMIKHLEDQPAYTGISQKFRDMLKQENIDEKALILSYKTTLATLATKCKPLVSPSTFKMGTDGKGITKGMDVNDMVDARYSGLSPDSQFTPLSAGAIEHNRELAKEFGKRYKNYRKKVVLPVFNYLKDCHRLITLVGVTDLLVAGVGMANDNKKCLELLLDAIDPKKGLLKSLIKIPAKLSKWRPAGVTRMAFVATKIDQVAPRDYDKIEKLLKKMISNRAGCIESLKTSYNYCSAIKSTEVVDDRKRWLRGFPARTPRREKKGYQVSKVPNGWPDDWNKGDYCFPRVWPMVPKNIDNPPLQIGLENVLNFIMDENFFE